MVDATRSLVFGASAGRFGALWQPVGDAGSFGDGVTGAKRTGGDGAAASTI